MIQTLLLVAALAALLVLTLIAIACWALVATAASWLEQEGYRAPWIVAVIFKRSDGLRWPGRSKKPWDPEV